MSAAMADPSADMDALMGKMERLQNDIDAANGWELDRQARRPALPAPCPLPVRSLSAPRPFRVRSLPAPCPITVRTLSAAPQVERAMEALRCPPGDAKARSPFSSPSPTPSAGSGERPQLEESRTRGELGLLHPKP